MAVGSIFLSGCNILPQAYSENYDTNIILSPKDFSSSTVKTGPEYQYAAPWDKDQFDTYFSQAKEVPDIGEVKGGIIPHHLTAGYIPATFFNYLSKQEPSVIVILGPNHFGRGGANAISTLRDWQTPYGITETDKKIVGRLAEKGIIKIDEGSLKEEHSLYSVIPFIKKSLPGTKVVPIMLAYKTDTEKLDRIIAELLPLLPSDAVIVGSIDFSHYQALPVANFHDEMSRLVIKNFDFERIDKLEIDSTPSLYVVLKLMQNFGAQKVGYELSDNSANILRDPTIKETTSYYSPYFTKGETNAQKSASILHFGDLMLDRNVQKQISEHNSDYILEKLAGQENRFFMGVDEIGANLEGPFANVRRPTSKSIAFRFDPMLIKMLTKYNFSLFTSANNHTFDMGKDGFEESKNNLNKAGVSFYGSQYNINEESLIVKKVGDYDIGFLGLNDTNSPVNLEKVKKLIHEARLNADFVVVNIHWGEEYKEISNSHQRKLAREMIDAGADVIIGHHPHVVQEMEIYKQRPIFYSLGNFVFDQYFSIPTQQGLALGLVFYDNKISINIFPLQSNSSQVNQMDYATGIKYLDKWEGKSRNENNKLNNFNLVLPI